MATIRHVWGFIAGHWFDILVAFLFAFLFAVILDLLSFRSSHIIALFHYMKNRRSERSAKRLRERITQLEKQRDSYASYLNSDKALYLANFHILFAVLLVIASATGINVINEMQPTFGIQRPFPFGLFSVLFYFIASVLAVQGIKTASLDSREKLSESIAKLELEITDLKQKLQSHKRE